MAGIFNVFKKQPSTKQPSQDSVSENIATDNSSQNVVQTTSSQQKDEIINQVPSQGNHNGIGAPTQGQSYNGIGSPAQKPVPTTKDVQKVEDNKKQEEQSQKPVTSQTTQSKQEELDIMTRLTQRSNRIFIFALQKAKELQNDYIDSEHVLSGLLNDTQIYNVLSELKVYPQIIQQELQKVFKKGNSKNQPQPSPRIKLILQSSLAIARKLGFDFISPEHMLISLFEEGEGVGARILAKLGLKKEDLNKKIVGKKGGLNEKEDKDSPSQSVLEKFTKDLTAKALAGQLDPVVERSEVIERVIHILSRRTKNNPALVGEAGVGKTAIVEGLAQKIVKKEVPETLFDKRVLELDLMSIIAGASHRGEFEERMKKLIEEISASNKNIILFIDEIHNLVGAGGGGEGALDASNFLKPSLARGEIQMIGATTLTEYRKYIEKDPALERRFQQVLVPEPTGEQTIKMLKALRDKYEAFHKVRIPDSSIDSAVKLSKRYIGDRFLPDKAIDLIDEAGSAVRLPLISLPEEIRSLEERISQLNQEKAEADKVGEKVKSRILDSKLSDLNAELKTKKEYYVMKKGQATTEISTEVIKDIISRWTGIPVSKIAESETEKLKNLEEIMHRRLINQEVAVTAVAQAVRRGRAGLKSTQKPIGSFVFLGPTGVGKTELAKTLAEILFGLEDAIIRLDMTEFMEKHEVAKLLGAPPGYVGYEEGGKLTEAVRRKPYSVVLFDEVEKAHPDIFNILLQVLDDGRLTDNKGRVVSFKNTVVICTSNIGSTLIQDEILKAGNLDIQEPPVISTYAFTKDSEIILTMLNKVFIKKKNQDQWISLYTNEYFENQTLEFPKTKNSENIEKGEKPMFPIAGFDTHTFDNKGTEFITSKGNMYFRTKKDPNKWTIISLQDYFTGSEIKSNLISEGKNQFPTEKFKTHNFTPDGKEVITFGSEFIARKEGDKTWIKGELREYVNEINMDSKNHIPSQYWDINTSDANSTEYIVVGKDVWKKTLQKNTWEKDELTELLGPNFMLDEELGEKQKVQDELNQNLYKNMKSKVTNELRKFFKPELINRFDEVIIFEPLKFMHMIQIVGLQLKSLRNLLEEQNIGFSCSEKASKEIAHLGFDPIFGARPLKRTIQKNIENPISSLIIEGKVKENDTILVDYDGDNFVFNIERTVQKYSSQNDKNITKNYFCLKCGKNFSSIQTPQSTTICPNCATKDVHEDSPSLSVNQDLDEKANKMEHNNQVNDYLENNQSNMQVASA